MKQHATPFNFVVFTTTKKKCFNLLKTLKSKRRERERERQRQRDRERQRVCVLCVCVCVRERERERERERLTTAGLFVRCTATSNLISNRGGLCFSLSERISNTRVWARLTSNSGSEHRSTLSQSLSSSHSGQPINAIATTIITFVCFVSPKRHH